MFDLFQSVIIPAGVAAIAAIATVTTGAFGYWSRKRAHDIEMVRIALSILSGENKDSSLSGRRFALRTLQKHTGVDIPKNDFRDWVRNSTKSFCADGWPPNARIIGKKQALKKLVDIQRSLSQDMEHQ